MSRASVSLSFRFDMAVFESIDGGSRIQCTRLSGVANQLFLDIDGGPRQKIALILALNRASEIRINGEAFRLTYSQTQVAAQPGEPQPKLVDFATIIVAALKDLPAED